MRQQQQQVLKQELTIAQILRIHGKRFRQIRMQFSDGLNGRCALGVIMSYYGWNGHDDREASKRFSNALIALRHAHTDENIIVDMNDSGFTFDEIADHLDGNSKKNG